ncbi:MAG TPA: YHS domain-containing protein [Candidatus Omnitrophota bacterium]|nr:YHS domain-containing protein [Candidatus Omnitrophota bacterium]
MANSSNNEMDIVVLRPDPVCGKEVSFEKAHKKGLYYVYGHKDYVFCSSRCLKAFQLNPQNYAKEEVSDEMVGICEVCGKKMHKGEDISNELIEGSVHKFCCPVCASVYLKSH